MARPLLTVLSLRRNVMVARGFTLLEMMVVLSIAAILTAAGAYGFDRLVPVLRTDGAARDFLLDVRMAQAIATRTNQPVTVIVNTLPTGPCPGPTCCLGPSYSVVGAEGDPPVPYNYKNVCLFTEYPNVQVTSGGAEARGVLTCGDEPAVGVDPVLDPSGCSFCGGATGTLTILPTGQVNVAPVQSPTGTEAVAFNWQFPGEAANADDWMRTRVITLNVASGRTKPMRAVRNGAGWECR